MLDTRMPLILDNTISLELDAVEDLFGENVALSLPVSSHCKQLRQRLDDQRNRGCCQ